MAHLAGLLVVAFAACSRPVNQDRDPVGQGETSRATEFAAVTPGPLPARSSLPVAPPDAEVVAHRVSVRETPPGPRALEERYALASSGPEARQEIIQALGEISSPEAVDVLSRLFQREKREELKMAILEAIGGLDDDKVLEPKLSFFARAISPPYPRLGREVAITTLGDIEDPRVIVLLRNLGSDNDPQIRTLAAEMLRDLEK
jgi:HEAT repeat protein